MVGVAVTASTEPVTGWFARGCRYGRNPDESSELGLISNTVRIVSDGDQELAGYFGSDTWKVAEHRRVGVENFPKCGVSGGNFCRE